MKERLSAFRSRVLSWLRLFRLPNLFTVPGDPVLGYFAVGGNFHSMDLLYIVCASLFLYIFGLVDNDLCDYSEDLSDRPDRPLPSGMISRKTAKILRLVLAVCALLFADFVGIGSFIAALYLLLLIVFYNRFKRNRKLGAMLMGLCRVFNVVLGISAMGLSARISNPLLFSAVPMVWFFYIYGVSSVASGETKRQPVRGRAVVFLTICLWLVFCLITSLPDLHLIGTLPPGLFFVYSMLLVILCQGGCLLFYKLRGEPEPGQVQSVVGRLILGLIFLQATGCALLGAPLSDAYLAAIGLLLLWIPAWLVGHWVYGT